MREVLSFGSSRDDESSFVSLALSGFEFEFMRIWTSCKEREGDEGKKARWGVFCQNACMQRTNREECT